MKNTSFLIRRISCVGATIAIAVAIEEAVNTMNILLLYLYNYTEKYYNFSVVVKEGELSMFELDSKYEIDGILVKKYVKSIDALTISTKK